MRPVVWIHGDCLSPQHPALAAHPGAPAIFVWDEALLDQWQISLKRVVFIYECLLELPVTIRRGDVATEVLAFAAEHGADTVITSESPSPRFAQIKAVVEKKLAVDVLAVEPFVDYGGELDLRGFFRYWQAVEPLAFGAREQLNLWK